MKRLEMARALLMIAAISGACFFVGHLMEGLLLEPVTSRFEVGPVDIRLAEPLRFLPLHLAWSVGTLCCAVLGAYVSGLFLPGRALEAGLVWSLAAVGTAVGLGIPNLYGALRFGPGLYHFVWLGMLVVALPARLRGSHPDRSFGEEVVRHGLFLVVVGYAVGSLARLGVRLLPPDGLPWAPLLVSMYLSPIAVVGALGFRLRPRVQATALVVASGLAWGVAAFDMSVLLVISPVSTVLLGLVLLRLRMAYRARRQARTGSWKT